MTAPLPPGLPDGLFVRGEVPMTKSEVRALSLAAARLFPTARILDIGAGTGSLSIEAALLCPAGRVVAVERTPEAVDLIRRNLKRFELVEGTGDGRVEVVIGEAPTALADMALFDRVLVGGSGGRLESILDALPSVLRPSGRVVATSICLETTAILADRLRRAPWTGFDCVQITAARGVAAGPRLRFEAQNPVWISSADLTADREGRR